MVSFRCSIFSLIVGCRFKLGVCYFFGLRIGGVGCFDLKPVVYSDLFAEQIVSLNTVDEFKSFKFAVLAASEKSALEWSALASKD